MANLSKMKRDNMIAFLEQLKKEHSDDASIRAFNEIENHLREKKYGLVWEEHSEEVDELLSDAIELVVQAEQASVSMLQRRFRIGYNRAARLVDMMEARGIIGPADGSRPRKVLIDMMDLAEMQAQAMDDSVPEEI